MACEPLDIVAEVEGLDEDPTAVRGIRGQVAVATTPGRVRSVTLAPQDARACTQALDAIAAADLITFGPGSWFTSVLPHLLLPEMADAIKASNAHRLVVLNLAAQPARPKGSPRSSTWTYSQHTPRASGSIPCWRTGPRWHCRSDWHRPHHGWELGWTWTTSPSPGRHGTTRQGCRFPWHR